MSLSENAQAFSPGPRFCRRLERLQSRGWTEPAQSQRPIRRTAGAHPARCDHQAPTSATASGEVTRSSCDAPSHQLTEAAGARHPGPRPSQLLHSGSSQGATQRWHDQREDASGPPGRGGTTEGHGEEGKGSVGRWTTALAADPSLLASKMEPVFRDASPKVLGGLRRHSTWSAEKHLC